MQVSDKLPDMMLIEIVQDSLSMQACSGGGFSLLLFCGIAALHWFGKMDNSEVVLHYQNRSLHSVVTSYWRILDPLSGNGKHFDRAKHIAFKKRSNKKTKTKLL